MIKIMTITTAPIETQQKRESASNMIMDSHHILYSLPQSFSVLKIETKYCYRTNESDCALSLGVEVDIMIISDYRRGWEDALDVVLDLKDWTRVKKIRDRLRRQRLDFFEGGP